MRILHVIHSANPAGGGPIEGIKQLARAKLAHGHEVEVACVDAPDSPWIADFPLKIHALGPGWLRYGFTPRLIPWLRENGPRFDVVLVNGIWQFNSLAVWHTLRGTGVPYCVFTHGMLDPWFRSRYPLKHFKKSLYWPWAEYRVLRDADAVLFTCEEERIRARQSFRLYRAKEVVVNYGTSGPTGDAAAEREKFFEAFPETRGKRLLLFLGRVHEKKGCRELIEAFHRICGPAESAGAALHLVIAGPADSPYAKGVRQLATDLGLDARITWAGMIGGDLKWGAFRAAEAFILPSHQENFGISVAESLACGVPTLISNRVNIWREIEQDGAGLVEANTVVGTERLLARWLALEPAAREAMRRAAAACFLQRFEVGKAADDLLRVFASFPRRAAN